MKIVCDGSTSEFINVVVPEDQAYLASFAKVGFIVDPESAMYTKAEWSYDGSIVFNPTSGLVAPMYNTPCFGRLYLTLTDDFGNEYKATSYVTFSRNPIDYVKLDQNLVEVNVNDEGFQLSASVIGVNGEPADISEVIWSSSDSSVASVDENGNVTIHAGGYAEIKAESVVGGYHDICKVYVSTDKSALEAVLQQTIDENYQRLDYIETSYNAYLDAYNNAVTVYSNNEASQEEIDNATEWLTNAINALEPYIHVESIVIYNDVTGGSDSHITKKSAYIKNKEINLSYQINPGNSMYESITWSSDNSDITVDANGKVVINVNDARSANITLTVTDYYGVKYTKTVLVSFIRFTAVTGVEISKTEIYGYSGGSETLSCTVKPSGITNADVKDVIWSTSDEKVATVNQNGTVFFVDGGECYITVTTVEGGFTASCKVTVVATEAKNALAEEIKKAKAIDANLYTDDSYAVLADAIIEAERVYNTGLATTTQINEAIALLNSAREQLKYIPADYTSVNLAIEDFNSLDKSCYNSEDLDAIQQLIDNIDWDLDVSEQMTVESFAAEINVAIAELEEISADYTLINETIKKAQAIVLDNYRNPEVLDTPLANAIAASNREYKISEQNKLDIYANELEKAIAKLEYKSADKSALETALSLTLDQEYHQYYDADLLAEWQALVAEGQEMYDNDELTILDNEKIKAMATEIINAHNAVEASYKVVIYKDALSAAVEQAEALIPDGEIADDSHYATLSQLVSDAKELLASELTEPENQAEVDSLTQSILDEIEVLNNTSADYSELIDAVERFDSIDPFIYTDDSVKAVQDLINSINWDLKIADQTIVDELTQSVNDAIDNLVLTEETKIEAIEEIGATVDNVEKFIYGVDEGIDDVAEYVRVINGTLQYKETDDGFGTGTVVEVVDDEGTVVDSYTIVIFGDANGDGYVDGQDSLFIWMIIWSGDTSVNAYNIAADANRDGVIDELDVNLVEEVGALSATIQQR